MKIIKNNVQLVITTSNFNVQPNSYCYVYITNYAYRKTLNMISFQAVLSYLFSYLANLSKQ